MEENQDIFTSEVNIDTAQEMYGATKWTRLFSILIFIACGLGLLILLAAGSRIQDAFSSELDPSTGKEAFTLVVIIGVVAIVIVFIMMYFLFRSANAIRNGLQQKNQELFNRGLADMKVYFTIYGVFSILGLIGNLLQLL